jgi:hypothetical protein
VGILGELIMRKRSVIVLILGISLAMLIIVSCVIDTIKYKNIQKTYTKEQALIISDDGWDSSIKHHKDNNSSYFVLYIIQNLKIQYCNTEFTKDLEEQIYQSRYTYKPSEDTIYALYEAHRYKNGDTIAIYYDKSNPSDCYSQSEVDENASSKWVIGLSMGLPIITLAIVLAKLLNRRR